MGASDRLVWHPYNILAIAACVGWLSANDTVP